MNLWSYILESVTGNGAAAIVNSEIVNTASMPNNSCRITCN